MKRKLLGVAMLAATVLFAASCKDDDDEGRSNGYTLESTSKKIDGGFLSLDGSAGESPSGKATYFHEISFLSASANEESFGDVIAVTLTSETGELPAGEYSFVGSDTESEPGDFAYGYVTTDMFADAEAEYEFASGTIKVSKSGDNYTVEITGEVIKEGESAKRAVSVYYSGALDLNI